jgi:hypothetical protein
LRYSYDYENSSGSAIIPKYKDDVYYVNGVKTVNSKPGPTTADIAKVRVTYIEGDPLGECAGCFRGALYTVEVDILDL